MIITLTESGAPLDDQIQDQILGLITTGLRSAGQRLLSARPLACELGSGTRVSTKASATSRAVLSAAKHLVKANKREAGEKLGTWMKLFAFYAPTGPSIDHESVMDLTTSLIMV